jgi:hypothetical protein
MTISIRKPGAVPFALSHGEVKPRDCAFLLVDRNKFDARLWLESKLEQGDLNRKLPLTIAWCSYPQRPPDDGTDKENLPSRPVRVTYPGSSSQKPWSVTTVSDRRERRQLVGRCVRQRRRLRASRATLSAASLKLFGDDRWR